jgi:hypothetical protein
MNRASTLREILYYGSDRQQQYWENEAQTLRIARDSHSLVWKAYGKRGGVYMPLSTRSKPPKRSRNKSADVALLTGRSAEEVISLLQREHHFRLTLEQRLRRWINKTSGERVLAFLDPNLGGAPVLTAPSHLYSQEQKKTPYA